MSTYILSPAAANDIESIHRYIRQSNPTAADEVAHEIRESMRLIARHPGIGHAREEIEDDSVRFWPVFSYLIVYRSNTIQW
jgi:plasmid stabilization system protein ParE